MKFRQYEDIPWDLGASAIAITGGYNADDISTDRAAMLDELSVGYYGWLPVPIRPEGANRYGEQSWTVIWKRVHP